MWNIHSSVEVWRDVFSKPLFSKMKSDNDAVKLEAVTCKSKLDSATSFAADCTVHLADCKAQIRDKEIIVRRLQQENNDGIDRKLELSNMNRWKSEKEAAERQIEHLKSENQRFASLEGHYNLLLKSVFSYTFHPSFNNSSYFSSFFNKYVCCVWWYWKKQISEGKKLEWILRTCRILQRTTSIQSKFYIVENK